MSAEYFNNTMVLTGTVVSVGTALLEGVALREKVKFISGKKLYFTNVLLLDVPGIGKTVVHTIDVLSEKRGDYNQFAPGQTVTVNATLRGVLKNGHYLTNVIATHIHLVYTDAEMALIHLSGDTCQVEPGLKAMACQAGGLWMFRAVMQDNPDYWVFAAKTRDEFTGEWRTSLVRAIKDATDERAYQCAKIAEYNALQADKAERAAKGLNC